MTQVVVPDIGDFKDVAVIEVLVKPGDAVAKEQSLITLESDKATMEIPSPSDGVVREIKIKMGDKVSKGSPILELEAKDETARPQPRPEPKPEPKREAKSAAMQQARPESRPTGDGGSTTVPVPDIGDFKEVEVIEVLVKPGDAVAKEQSLITLESDKATMEIPSPSQGVVRELKIKVGDKVSKGSPILVLSATADSAPAAAASAPSAPSAPAQAPSRPAASARAAAPAPAPGPAPAPRPVPSGPQEQSGAKPHASPSVRKFARELGVDLRRVQGSGPKSRILHTDVQAFVKGALSKTPAVTAKAGGALPFDLPAWPDVDFAKFGPVETKPLSRIQKLSGPYLHRNWISIPHVTQFDEADITDLEAFRKAQTAETEKKGFKLTMLAFMIKACVTALRQFPVFNSSLDKSGENVIIKKYYHVGVAVDTPGGLVVPVVRDADRKGVFDLAHELSDISKLAREGKLKPGDLQGGTFSISSLGGIGGTAFTPIINAPEVAILGVSRGAYRPVYAGKDEKGKDLFNARLMLPLALSYDHRVIDGATAARFSSFLVSVLSDIRKLIL
jgi:pyruvate dehydrogenase E2 component (dihydrolipoamide acetyltransferase)